MIALSKNKNKLLEKVPYVKNPKDVPDIVLYPEIFNKDTIEKIQSLLEKMNFNKNGQIWLADNPYWVYGKDLPVQPFPLFIEEIRDNVEKITCRSFNACLINKYKDVHKHRPWYKTSNKWFGENFITPSVSFGSIKKVTFISKQGGITREVNIRNGSLLVERESIKKYWTVNIKQEDKTEPFYNLSFFRIYPDDNLCTLKTKKEPVLIDRLPLDLSKIYLSSKMRMIFSRKIRNGLSGIRSIPEGSQCFMKNGINELSQYIKLSKFIASGDWGNVYSAYLAKDTKCRRKFAIKMSRITDDDFKDPYTETSTAWYEIWMLKDILKPLVKKNICPNLPLFIDTFLCNKCDFVFRKGDNTHPCVITAMELASGDLRDYLKFGTPTDDELYSALFQIMAGLHAIQMSAQILNNDIKSKNILYYNVNPGGFWHYRIGNEDFYVPNYGKMFVINDFGVSTLYDPNFQLYPNKKTKVFNLGSRFAINMDETFSPIEANTEYCSNGLRKTKDVEWRTISKGDLQQVSKGATYKIDRKTGQVILSHTLLTPIQKSYLFRHGITTNPKTWGFFEHPYVIPPFEFYDDVQDVLRTFVGGKRSTQKGDHILYQSVSKRFQRTIQPFLGLAENSKARDFSLHTYHVLAGSFIKLFFTKSKKYQTKPNGKKINYYDMNKCAQSRQY